MKCFECGHKCLTVYCIDTATMGKSYRWVISPNALDKIMMVRKDCMNCKWHSHPTKIPEAIE
jgi:expansin (peptidoglycan-binding protein)